MKNKRILVVALSAGLVFAGGIVGPSVAPVAYAEAASEVKRPVEGREYFQKDKNGVFVKVDAKNLVYRYTSNLEKGKEQVTKDVVELWHFNKHGEFKVPVLDVFNIIEVGTREVVPTYFIKDSNGVWVEVKDITKPIRRENKDMYVGDEKVVGTQSYFVFDANKIPVKKGELNIIEYGSKVRPVAKVEIAYYQTIKVPNANMYEGTSRIAQKGRNGEWTITNGVRKLTKNPLDEIIEYGTKKRETKVIPFAQIVRINPNKYEDEITVIQAGKNGLAEKDNNGVWVRKVNPVDEIIEKGSKKRVVVTKEVAKYQTIRRANANMYVGDEKVVQKGINGEWTITNGVKKLTKSPTDEIIEYGTKARPVVEKYYIKDDNGKWVEVNPANTIYKYSPKLAWGQIKESKQNYFVKDKNGVYVKKGEVRIVELGSMVTYNFILSLLAGK